MTPLAFTAIALILGAAAATTDALRGRIPNTFTLPVMAMAPLLHALVSPASALQSVAGCVVAAFVPWVLYRASSGRAIGGGDVKLFAALGALTGAVAGLQIELSACVVLAAFAAVQLAFRGRLLHVLANSARLALNPLLPERMRRPIVPEVLTEMRMGPAIFLAVVNVTFANQLVRWFPWLPV